MNGFKRLVFAVSLLILDGGVHAVFAIVSVTENNINLVCCLDPNESSEGEVADVLTNNSIGGEFSVGFSGYTYSGVRETVTVVNGDGDELYSVTSTSEPVPNPTLANFTTVLDALEIASTENTVFETTAGLLTAEVPPVAITLLGSQAMEILAEHALSSLFVDPPGVDFTQIITPTFLTVPTILPGGVFTPTLAGDANTLLIDEARVEGFIAAAGDVYQELGAAVAAGSLNVGPQLNAYYEFLAEAASASNQVAQDETNFLTALQQAGVVDVPLTQTEILAFQGQLASSCTLASFPTVEQNLFIQAGLTSSELTSICTSLLSVNPASVPTSLYAGLTQGAVVDQLLSGLLTSTDQQLFVNFHLENQLPIIPEPATGLLLGAGLLGLGMWRAVKNPHPPVRETR